MYICSAVLKKASILVKSTNTIRMKQKNKFMPFSVSGLSSALATIILRLRSPF